MLSLLALAPLALPVFAPPIPWALNFSPAGRIPMVADIDGDGFADLVCVSPSGDSFIDVAVNGAGMKSLQPQRAFSNWGKDCQGACVGNVDGVKGDDVIGVFGGDMLRLAHAFKNNAFADEPEWVKLPQKLSKPHLAFVDGNVYAWDENSGRGFKVANKVATPISLPKHVSHIDAVIAGAGHAALFTFAGGDVHLADTVEAKPSESLGKCSKGLFPAVAHGWIFLDEPAAKAPIFIRKRLTSPYPIAPEAWCAGDMDGDGDVDLIEFRFGSEAHTGNNVLLHRRISVGETDSDHDGLTNEEELKLGTDPYNPDTDGDGLLDGWEVNGFRGLDMKGMGCDPKRIDTICLVKRFSNAKKEMVENTMKTIQGYYTSLGWALHPIWLDEMNEADQKRSWWENRDRNIPAKWKGVVHFMQISPYGGGQADQLGDGGGCGGNEWSLYATFIHEFGHQLGLSHEGFYQAAWCPTYPSMMNYAYSYGYEGDIKKIRYSDGSLKDFVMRETDLDETLPLPYEKVKFLESAPYHYHLKPNGATTLIDWNWNGIFGEKHVRADINYAYSTTAGRRDEVGKTQSSPFTFTHGRDGYVLYAQQGVKPDGKSDPSVLPDKPGWIMMRRLIKPYKWADAVKIEESGVTGDPVAISYHNEIVVAYPTAKGVAVRWIKTSGDKLQSNELTSVDNTTAIPSLGVFEGRLLLFELMPGGYVRYRTLTSGHKFGDDYPLLSSGDYATIISSTVPVGLAEDTDKKELIVGSAEDQDKDRPSRWEIRRFRWDGKLLKASTPDPHQPYLERQWIEGEKGGARGRSRPVVLYDSKGITGMKGRILFFGQGSISKESPWSCEYVAESVADKTVGGGWMVKRFYDEWTQSRSAPAACWYNGDILYSYRWADGSQGDRDNILHVAYNGSGIEDVPMGDFDDIGFMKSFGIRHAILYLRE